MTPSIHVSLAQHHKKRVGGAVSHSIARQQATIGGFAPEASPPPPLVASDFDSEDEDDDDGDDDDASDDDDGDASFTDEMST